MQYKSGAAEEGHRCLLLLQLGPLQLAVEEEVQEDAQRRHCPDHYHRMQRGRLVLLHGVTRTAQLEHLLRHYHLSQARSTKMNPMRLPEVIRHPVICASPAGKRMSQPQSKVSGIRGMKMAPCMNTSTTAIEKLLPRVASISGMPTLCTMPNSAKGMNTRRYLSVFQMQSPSKAALTIPTTIIIAAKQLTSSEVNPQQSSMLSSSDPQMLKEPRTTPKEKSSVRNFLSLKSCLMAVKYSTFSAYEPAETGVGGLSWNHIRTATAGSRQIRNSTKRSTVNYSWILLLTSESTKSGGMRKPTAVPMMLATERIARASERFLGMNHLTATLVGALRMKGWPMAHRICPSMTKAKCVVMRQRKPAPTAVKTAPTTIPFLMPLTSSTQLEGKLTKTQMIMQHMGMMETTASDCPQARPMGTAIGEAVTQHMPFAKASRKKIASIRYRSGCYLYSVYSPDSRSLLYIDRLLSSSNSKNHFLLGLAGSATSSYSSTIQLIFGSFSFFSSLRWIVVSETRTGFGFCADLDDFWSFFSLKSMERSLPNLPECRVNSFFTYRSFYEYSLTSRPSLLLVPKIKCRCFFSSPSLLGSLSCRRASQVGIGLLTVSWPMLWRYFSSSFWIILSKMSKLISAFPSELRLYSVISASLVISLQWNSLVYWQNCMNLPRFITCPCSFIRSNVGPCPRLCCWQQQKLNSFSSLSRMAFLCALRQESSKGATTMVASSSSYLTAGLGIETRQRGSTLISGIMNFSILNSFFSGILSRYRKVDILGLMWANQSFGGYTFLYSSMKTTLGLSFITSFAFYTTFSTAFYIGFSAGLTGFSFTTRLALASNPWAMQNLMISVSFSMSSTQKLATALLLYCCLMYSLMLASRCAKKQAQISLSLKSKMSWMVFFILATSRVLSVLFSMHSTLNSLQTFSSMQLRLASRQTSSPSLASQFSFINITISTSRKSQISTRRANLAVDSRGLRVLYLIIIC